MTSTYMLDDYRVFEAIRILRPGIENIISRGPLLSDISWGDVAPVTDEEVESVMPSVDTALAFGDLRRRRNELLTNSDWTQLPDSSVVDAQAWADYRQALRDLPQTTLDPLNPTWPAAPSES